MQTQQQTPTMACNLLVPGKFQPREYFDPAAHEELTASIKAQGVLQSLLIRPFNNGYEIVAGERRWRAAIAAHGDTYKVPVIIRQMTDEEATEAALTENAQRENMSLTEEAAAATKVLGDHSGNRIEAAKSLGWSQTKFESRLALMNCSPNVRKALNERKIKLGHAELLAALAKEKQDIALQRMFAAPTLPSVTEIKGFLNELSQKLATAIFDKTDCAACQHNSSCQSLLFTESIDAGKCTHDACFKTKTEEELDKRAVAIRENYPVVRIVRAGENNTLLKLKAEGETGVGEIQAKACRGCANFGAAISAVPDKLGAEYRDLCFDPACNAKKVAENRKVVSEANKAAQNAAKKAPAPTKGNEPATAGANANTEAPATATTTATPPKVQDSTRLKEYRVKVWRKLLKELLLSDPAKNLVALLALTMTGNGSKISSSDLAKAYEKQTGYRPEQFDIAALAGHIDSAEALVKGNTHLGLAATMVSTIEERTLTQLLVWSKLDLAADWVLNKEYLELLTKSEIEVVAEEIGLKAHFGDKFGKVMSGKKDELLKALLNAEGFDYARKVPKHLLWS